jgi:hypothetical protein
MISDDRGVLRHHAGCDAVARNRLSGTYTSQYPTLGSSKCGFLYGRLRHQARYSRTSEWGVVSLSILRMTVFGGFC